MRRGAWKCLLRGVREECIRVLCGVEGRRECLGVLWEIEEGVQRKRGER